MNKLFVMVICMVSGSVQAMVSSVITQDDVTLLVGEGQDTVEIEIPIRYARLSKTLQGSLESCNDEKLTVPVPLSRKAGVFVVEQLEPLYQYSYQDQREALDSVKDAVSKLDGITLVLVVRALEHLDIPVLPKIVYEELLKRSPAWIASYCVKLLPRTIRCAVLRNQVAHFLDLKYADVPVAASRDDETLYYQESRPLIIFDHDLCRVHKGPVFPGCVTADNKIVSGSRDCTVRVFAMQGNQLAVCRGHEEGIKSVCVTGDNKIVSASWDKTVRVFDMRGNALAACRGHEDWVMSVYVTSDNTIVSGSADNTVRVWDIQGNQLAVCRGHEGLVNSVCVTADNKIISGAYDHTVRVFDLRGNELAVCRGHKSSVISVCLSSDNKIVSGSWDSTVRVWDIQGRELAVCRGHERQVSALFVTGDNKIISGAHDNTVRVFDMRGNELALCRGHFDFVYSVCITDDNKIVSGSDDGTVRIWDTEKLTLLEKAISVASVSVEKSEAIWELIQKYYAGTEDTQGFCNELKALIA